MTIQEARRYGTGRLSRIYDAGESASINDWVLEHITGLRMTERAANPNRELTGEQAGLQAAYLERLLTHEPVQYVLGETWFCGLRFKVNSNVLIPRPETEELAEWVISNSRFPLSEIRMLDIGTGSGCLAISLKRRLGKAEVWACDISTGALALAQENAASLGVDVKFREVDFLAEEARAGLPDFDLIISNPPYIPERDRADMQPNVLAYEPEIALFVPDDDPLLFYRTIASFGREHLRSGGQLFLEIHESFGQQVVELLEQNGYRTELKADMQGKERMVRGVWTGILPT